ncbi:hypothetical protein EOD42_00245 [Rhodovarius crocodyli]|uniref:Uncharacterized protein n=1 Tax=Rhodovarius crocodyli TaxID=1979269 RepID=A0A437MLT4_9PROT|nr:hypothetical protein [Rhodovarius crocodyli]RVT98583.1 hypothetical protein EOD42_00245 [Rhodovarius crocodyli]
MKLQINIKSPAGHVSWKAQGDSSQDIRSSIVAALDGYFSAAGSAPGELVISVQPMCEVETPPARARATGPSRGRCGS